MCLRDDILNGLNYAENMKKQKGNIDLDQYLEIAQRISLAPYSFVEQVYFERKLA